MIESFAHGLTKPIVPVDQFFPVLGGVALHADDTTVPVLAPGLGTSWPTKAPTPV